MPTSIASIGIFSLLLPVAWQADPELTYTIQQSNDLSNWQTLPMVISGSDAGQSIVLDMNGSPVFARLRFSPDGDSNENGLPDHWEWEKFGYLDVDPGADPDLDGKSNLQEFSENTDPQDYFDGEIPILRLTCGREWLVSPGEVSLQAVSLHLEHPTGEPWANAPVVLYLNQGLGSLRIGEEPGSGSLVVLTDSSGRIHQGLDPIHYLAPSTGSQYEVLEISAGRAREELIIRTTSSPLRRPPHNLVRSINPDGNECYRWSGDPQDAESFRLEKQNESGEWTTLVELAANEVALLEDTPGHYSLSIASSNP